MFRALIVVLLVVSFVFLFIWPGMLTCGVPFWFWETGMCDGLVTAPAAPAAEAPDVDVTLQRDTTIIVPPQAEPQGSAAGTSQYSEPLNGHRLQPEETWTVPQGWSCSGDFVVNGIGYFDNDASTGEVGYAMSGNVSITAPYGGFCDASPASVKATQMKINGCEANQGCRDVHPTHNW